MRALVASPLLIALLSVAQPVGAQKTAWLGTLAADQPYTINVDNAQNSVGKTTVVVYYLTGGKPATAEREARLAKAKVDLLIVSAGARETSVHVIPKGTRAISIDMAPPANGTLIVDVRQGAFNFSSTFTGGGVYLLDVQ